MIDSSPTSTMGSHALAGLVAWLGSLDRLVDDRERVDQIRMLEELKSAAAAAQARVTAEFARSQRSMQAAAGVPARDLGRGVAAQVALARRDSPVKGSRHLGLATALVQEMPHTLAALERGLISEWRATLLVRETACLSREDRTTVDAELAGRLGEMGDRQTARQARRIAYRLNPQSVVSRNRRALTERRVTIRPAPDTMSFVTGLLPAAQGVAVIAALTRHADTMRAQGDVRLRGQIMADTFVERLTGQTAATGVPIEVNLVMSQATMLGRDDTPADLQGYGPVPAPLARELVRRAAGDGGGKSADECAVWLRRLFSRPGDGALVAMESARRLFPVGLRRFLILRDQTCRTPWCDAPIRHADHVVAVADGGATTAENGQGLCEACNHAKQALGWRSRPGPHGAVATSTPTGHSYQSRPPPQPRPAPRSTSRLDIYFREIVAAA